MEQLLRPYPLCRIKIQSMRTLLFVLVGAICYTANVRAQNTNTAVQTAFAKSYAFEKDKLYEKASLEIRRIYDENSYEHNLRLGWLQYQAGKYNESLGYYQKSVNLQPNSIEAKLGIVYPLSAQLNWDAVLKEYSSILKLNPQNKLINYRTGLIYYNTKKYTEAQKYFDTLLELYPFDYDGIIISAWNHLKLQKLAEAKVLFQKALLYNPEDASALEGMKLIK